MDAAALPVASMSAVKARDKATWLALFEPDAVVQDPVGPCDWDPTGDGQRGIEAISAFWDMFMTFQKSFDFEVHFMAVRAGEVAAHVTMTMTYTDGTVNPLKAINLYKASPNGKIALLRSFWN